jgi:hypothetical protein
LIDLPLPAVVAVLTVFIHFHPLWCSAVLALHEWLTENDSAGVACSGSFFISVEVTGKLVQQIFEVSV